MKGEFDEGVVAIQRYLVQKGGEQGWTQAIVEVSCIQSCCPSCMIAEFQDGIKSYDTIQY